MLCICDHIHDALLALVLFAPKPTSLHPVAHNESICTELGAEVRGDDEGRFHHLAHVHMMFIKVPPGADRVRRLMSHQFASQMFDFAVDMEQLRLDEEDLAMRQEAFLQRMDMDGICVN